MHFSRYASSRKTNFLFYRSELFRGRRGAFGSITHETAICKEISMSENTGYTHPEVLVDAGWLQANLADPMVRLIEVDVDTTAYQQGHIPGAFWILKYYGHRDVRLLNGGRKKWLADKREITTQVPTYSPTSYAAQAPRNSIRAFRDQVLLSLGCRDGALVDVRSPGEFSGKLLAPANWHQEGAQRGGHIPGAINIPWAMAVRKDGTFKSAEELRALYE